MKRTSESGQTIVEFALILPISIMLVAGLLSVGKGFFQYNAVSQLARQGARWGGVIGGTCTQAGAVSIKDFCNQLGAAGITNFWGQPGNAPIQGVGVDCPSFLTTPADYYSVSTYQGTGATTIVGEIATHYDTSAASTGFIGGQLNAGFDLSKLKVCIALSSAGATPLPGDAVTVSLYYPFTPVGTSLTRATLALTAISRYEVE